MGIEIKHEVPELPKKTISISAEVAWSFQIRNSKQIAAINKDRFHLTPSTPDQLERSKMITDRLLQHVTDAILGQRFSTKVMELADELVLSGEITEEGFLSVAQKYNELMNYPPVDWIPQTWAERYGSIRGKAKP